MRVSAGLGARCVPDPRRVGKGDRAGVFNVDGSPSSSLQKASRRKPGSPSRGSVGWTGRDLPCVVHIPERPGHPLVATRTQLPSLSICRQPPQNPGNVVT